MAVKYVHKDMGCKRLKRAEMKFMRYTEGYSSLNHRENEVIYSTRCHSPKDHDMILVKLNLDPVRKKSSHYM
jgi:hypothetical protein